MAHPSTGLKNHLTVAFSCQPDRHTCHRNGQPDFGKIESVLTTTLADSQRAMIVMDTASLASMERSTDPGEQTVVARIMAIFRQMEATGSLQTPTVITLSNDPALSLGSLRQLLQSASQASLSRRDSIIAIGSVACLDIVSAAASMYRRGLPIIRIGVDHRTQRAPANQQPIAVKTTKTSYRLGYHLKTAIDLILYQPSHGTGHNNHYQKSYSYSLSWHYGIGAHLIDSRQNPNWLSTIAFTENSLIHALVNAITNTRRLLLVIDDYPGQAGDQIQQWLAEHSRKTTITSLKITASAQHKDLEAVEQILNTAASAGLQTSDLLIVVGGGTVMDIAGEAAALYNGGLRYLRVPTTLVGLIDAGIGLKVGVNFEQRKNLIGAYYPPQAVFCDYSFINSLPLAEVHCGLAEIVKIAAVRDATLFELVESHYSDLLQRRWTPKVEQILHRASAAMLEELEANPFEVSLRRLPDYGHEFGHMLEELSGYQLRHGEAVAIGMLISNYLAVSLGLLAESDYQRILNLIIAIGLPTWHPCVTADNLWQGIFHHILPHKGGQLHLVVPHAIGVGGFVDSADNIDLAMLTRACNSLAQTAVTDSQTLTPAPSANTSTAPVNA